jgi:MFS transporter, CP family, cyanate transporter
MVLVGLNLRLSIAAISPVLTQIQDDTGLGSAASGVLTALPLVCFGLVAVAAPGLVRRLPMARLLGLVLVVIAAGVALRSVPATAALFAGTAVIGSAIAIGNVVMPGLIKRDFREGAAPMIALYSLSLSLAAAITAGLTVPFEDLTGLDWRGAIAVWGAFAVIALVLWIPQARRSDRAAAPASTEAGEEAPAAPAPNVGRELLADRLAWAVTLFMGFQALGFYATLNWLPTILESHGFSDGHAGWMLSYSLFPSMAASLATPVLERRVGRAEPFVIACVAFWAIGYVGLIVAPTSATYVWMTSLGIAVGMAISLALGFIVARARDGHHVAHLSTMAQGVGYAIAAVGPFLVGALHGLTDSWTVALLFLIAVLVPTLVAGLAAARRGHVLEPWSGDAEVVP